MATHYDHITEEQADLIRASKVFFVASVAPDVDAGPEGQGPVNLSPKGGVPLHIIDANRIAYLDYGGSGNETARRAEAGGPVTPMVMSMDGDDAAIVRLYGHARATPLADSTLAAQFLDAPADDIGLPQRQVIEVTVEHTQTSCGYGVPVFGFVRDRTKKERGRRYKASTNS